MATPKPLDNQASEPTDDSAPKIRVTHVGAMHLPSGAVIGRFKRSGETIDCCPIGDLVMLPVKQSVTDFPCDANASYDSLPTRAVVDQGNAMRSKGQHGTKVNEHFADLISSIENGQSVSFNALERSIEDNPAEIVDLSRYAPVGTPKSIYFEKDALLHELRNKEISSSLTWVALVYSLAYRAADVIQSQETSFSRLSARKRKGVHASFETVSFQAEQNSKAVTVRYQGSQPVPFAS